MTDSPAVASDDMAGESPQNRRVVNLVLHILLMAVSIVMLYPLLWMLAALCPVSIGIAWWKRA